MWPLRKIGRLAVSPTLVLPLSLLVTMGLCSIGYGSFVVQIDRYDQSNLSTPAKTISVTDNMSGDASSEEGVIKVARHLGDMIVSLTLATSSRTLGGTPSLSVSQLDIAFGSAGVGDQIVVTVTDTDFALNGTSSTADLISSVAALTLPLGSSIEFESWIDESNTQFGTSGTTTDPLSLTTALTSASTTETVDSPSSSFSLTSRAIITVGQAGSLITWSGSTSILPNSSTVPSVSSTPEPTALAIWSGLAVLGLVGSRIVRRT